MRDTGPLLGIGYIISILALLLLAIYATVNYKVSGCDDIVRSNPATGPDSFLVCEINMQAEDDYIRVITER